MSSRLTAVVVEGAGPHSCLFGSLTAQYSWDRYYRLKGSKYKSKKQPKLINMRGQDWPNWEKGVAWCVSKCVWRYQRVCVISAKKKKKKKVGQPAWWSWNESMCKKRAGTVGCSKTGLIGLLSGSMRAICLTSCWEAEGGIGGELSQLCLGPRAPTLCKRSRVWKEAACCSGKSAHVFF